MGRETMGDADVVYSGDPAMLDIDLVHGFLSNSYWAQGRSRDTVARSIQHSLCMGAYLENSQVGFARLVTDRAVFAYLADVFVLPPQRGRGIASGLVARLMAHPEVQGLSTVLLKTDDAHPLYRRMGFSAISDPERFMVYTAARP